MARPKLSNVSITALHAEIQRRLSKLKSLITQRDDLNKEIATIEALSGQAPAAAKPATKGKRRGRKPGRMAKVKRATGKPLAQYVHEVLAATEKGLSLKEIEAKVRAAGYPTTADSIYKPILAVLSKGFKRVERGVYAMKAAVKAGKKAAKAAMATKAAAKAPKAKKTKRGTFKETAEQFVLGLVKGKSLTTAQVNAAWKKEGRGGAADTTLGKLVKEKKVTREPVKGGRGSTYSLA